jgi:hypothetical protein
LAKTIAPRLTEFEKICPPLDSSGRRAVPASNKKEAGTVRALAMQGEESISCEINYPNGVRLKLKGCLDYEILRSLLLLNPRQ